MTASQSLRVCVCLMTLLAASACTTMHELPDTHSASVTTEIEAGDRVVITTSSGETVKMKVDEIGTTGLTGDDEFVAYSDMQSLAVRRSDEDANSKVKTTVGVFAIVAGILLEAIGQTLAMY